MIVVDEVDSELSQSVATTLQDSEGLRLVEVEEKTTRSRTLAGEAVRDGTATLAIVMTRSDSQPLAVELLTDSSDVVASQVVSAMVSQAIGEAQSHRATQDPGAHGAAPTAGEPETTGEAPQTHIPVSPTIQVVDLIGEGKTNPVVSMYAAGIAVMFVLFGASGAGGALLEERENATLDRLLSSHMTMDDLLLGKWFYQTLLGFLQVTVMFVWGQIIFDVDLLGHLDGFAMMTLVTCGAAAAMGLFLATLCRSRGQLNGLSVILILTMSALGGSMVPRYVMSEKLQSIGLWTFNAWALDGYNKVFWRDLGVETLWPQLAVLMGAAVAFLLVARLLATRWETD